MISYKTALTLTFPPTQILLCFPQFFLLLVQDNRLSTLLSLYFHHSGLLKSTKLWVNLSVPRSIIISSCSVAMSVHHNQFFAQNALIILKVQP